MRMRNLGYEVIREIGIALRKCPVCPPNLRTSLNLNGISLEHQSYHFKQPGLRLLVCPLQHPNHLTQYNA